MAILTRKPPKRREIAALLELLSQKKDPKAAERLGELYSGRLHGLAYRLLLDRQAAEDAVQDVFLALLLGKARYRGRGHPDAFLLRVTSFIALDRARKVRLQRKVEEASMARPRGTRDGSSLDPVLRKELEEEVLGLLGELRPEVRAAVSLHFWQGATIREVARLVSATRSTVSRWIEEGLRKLRAPLIGKGFGAGAAVILLRDLLRGVEVPPLSVGFQEALGKVLISFPAERGAGIPSFPEDMEPAFAVSAPIGIAAGASVLAVVALILGVMLLPGKLASWRESPQIASSPSDDAEGNREETAGTRVSPDPSGKSPAGLVLSGRVQDEQGRPAAGARVRLHRGEGNLPGELGMAEFLCGPPLAESRAGAKGDFRFEELSKGSYRILALAEGSSPGTPGLLRVKERESLADLRIILPPGGAVEGRVRLETGEPVEGIAVEAYLGATLGSLSQGVWVERIVSGPGGRFRIPGIGTQVAAISVRADRHSVVEAPRYAARAQGSIEVVLSTGGSLAGKVLLPGGKAAPAAEVLAFSKLEPEGRGDAWGRYWIIRRRAISGADGRFLLPGLAPGAFLLFARKDGFALTGPFAAEVPSGPSRSKDLALALENGKTIEGRFVSGEGPSGPARGIAFRVQSLEEASGEPVLLFQDPSEAHAPTARFESVAFEVAAGGEFETPPLRPGEYFLAAYRDPEDLLFRFSMCMAAGAGEKVKRIFHEPGLRGVEIAPGLPEKALSIEGKVVDEKGRGIPGSRVRCSFSQGGGSTSTDAFCDQRGVFEILPLLPDAGRFETLGLLAQAPDGRTGALESAALKTRGKLGPFQIVLDSGAAISAAVKSAEGGPIQGALVRLEQDGHMPFPQAESREARTDREGRFLFESVQADRLYKINVTKEKYGKAVLANIEVGGLDEDIVLQPQAVISGRLADLDGKPVDPEGFAVTRTISRSSGESSESFQVPFQKEGEGRFAILELPPGTYTLAAYGKAGPRDNRPWSNASGKIALEAGQTVDGIQLTLTRLVKVSGTVVDAVTAKPVPGAAVADWDLESGSFPRNRARVSADGTGRFQIDGIPRGDLRLHAAAEGYMKFEKSFDISGENDEDVVIELTPSQGIIVQAVDGNARPIAGARVLSGLDWPPRGPRGDLLTDAKGIAVLPAPATGKLEESKAWIEVHKDGFVRARIDLTPEILGQGRALAVLQIGGSVSGAVLDHEGRPVQGIEVFATRNRRGQGTSTSGRGAYRIDGLEPGEYTLSLSSGESPLPSLPRDAAISAGEDVRIDFRIPDPATFRFHSVAIAGVLDDGRPAAGARIHVFDGKIGSGAAQRSVPPLSCFARRHDLALGPDGTLEILFEEAGVDGISFSGSCEADGEQYQTQGSIVDVVDGRVRVVFQRSPRGTLDLKVMDAETGRPVRKYSYTCEVKGRGKFGSQCSSQSGEERLRPEPGEIVLRVSSEGYSPAEASLRLEDRGKESLEIRLRRE